MKRTFNYFPRARSIPRSPSPLWLVLLVLAALVAGLILLTETHDKAMREAETQDTGAVDITGLEETVFDWSQDACEPADIPDTPAHAFRDAQGRVQLVPVR